LVISEGKIADIIGESALPANVHTVDLAGGYILPGFIDIHLHGGGGHDFMDGTVESIQAIGDTHVRHGTTAIVPTTVACTKEELFSLFDIYRQAVAGSRNVQFLGLHLEGPFISLEMRGAQKKNALSSQTTRWLTNY
jgi:N-acetylglucosamine-6-phosphate deacetylase